MPRINLHVSDDTLYERIVHSADASKRSINAQTNHLLEVGLSTDGASSAGESDGLPSIAGLSAATSNENAYQIDAARSLITAAAELRRASDRVAEIAVRLSEGDTQSVGYFPSAGMVRYAMSEYRRNVDVLNRFESALESAMLADRERSLAPSGKED